MSHDNVRYHQGDGLADTGVVSAVTDSRRRMGLPCYPRSGSTRGGVTTPSSGERNVRYTQPTPSMIEKVSRSHTHDNVWAKHAILQLPCYQTHVRCEYNKVNKIIQYRNVFIIKRNKLNTDTAGKTCSLITVIITIETHYYLFWRHMLAAAGACTEYTIDSGRCERETPASKPRITIKISALCVERESEA